MQSGEGGIVRHRRTAALPADIPSGMTGNDALFWSEGKTMAKKKFKCSKCSRTFSMAAHLARHQASHAPKKTARKKGKKKAVRGRGRTVTGKTKRRGRPRGSGGVLAALRAYHSQLLARRSAIDEQITGIEAAITVL